MRILLFIVILLVVISTAQAAIYKCKIDGKTIFSDSPCNGEVEQQVYRQTDPSLPTSGIQQQSSNPPATSSSSADISVTDLETKYFILDEEISRAKHDLEKLKDEQAAELEKLKRKKDLAMNNNAGANWEQSISTEMAAVVELYNKRIDRVIADIDRDENDLEDIKTQIKTMKKVYY